MKELFASIIERLVYHDTYTEVMYEGSAYTFTFLGILLVPILLELIFYFLWDPIPAKFWKWMIIFPISFILVVGLAVWLANDELLEFLDNDEFPDATSYIFEYAIWSGILSFVPFLLGAVLKFFSTNNKYNPF